MKKQYDIVVVGGGVSGIAAAIAASDQNKSVALIEKAPFLGGKGTSAEVGTICGAYLRSTIKEAAFVCGGFPKVFVEQLAEVSNSKPIKNKEGLHYLPYKTEAMIAVCDQFVFEKNIDVYLQSTLYDVKQTSSVINSIEVLVYDCPTRFEADAFVDCSGDAIIGKLSNTELISSDQYQASAKVFTISNIDLNKETIHLSIFKAVKKGQIDNKILAPFTQISIVPGSITENSLSLKIGIPKTIENEHNQMTEINRLSRMLIQQIFGVLKSNVNGFENAKISSVAPEVGIRTGARYNGSNVLTKAEVLGCEKIDQSIGRGAWPIEHWNYDAKPRMEYFDEADYYDINIDTLRSDGFQNLFFAGRNMSADDDAIASARVMGTCLQTGFAAGILASQFGALDIEQIIKIIQTKLEIQNADC